MSQKLSSAAVMIGALRVLTYAKFSTFNNQKQEQLMTTPLSLFQVFTVLTVSLKHPSWGGQSVSRSHYSCEHMLVEYCSIMKLKHKRKYPVIIPTYGVIGFTLIGLIILLS